MDSCLHEIISTSKKSVGWHYVNITVWPKVCSVFSITSHGKTQMNPLDQAIILFSHLFCVEWICNLSFCVEKHPERDHFFQKVFVINKLDGQAYKVKILLTI